MTLRSILITGASSGIGEALALEYAAPSVFLFLSGRNRERLDEVAGRCRQKGATVSTSLADVRDPQAIESWIRACDSAAPLDLVIANAGISGGTGGAGESSAQIADIFAVNLSGLLNTILPAIALMTPRGCGQVALMASLASFSGWPGAPAYGASKGAVRLYGEALRPSLALSGIKVNVICPGFVESRMTAVNDYPMPFLIPADKAARIIIRGLARNQGRIAFPWQTYGIAGLIGLLPYSLSSIILENLPAKPAREVQDTFK